MEAIIFKPRVAPRDIFDVFIGLPLGLLLAIILLGLPACVVAIATQSVLLGFVAYFAASVLLYLFMVSSVRLDATGITFRRVLGSPRFLAWGSVTEITKASRQEVIFQGWIWPIFPPREATPCMSSLDHVRIDWSSGHCYFPPQEIESFLETFESFRHASNKSI